MKIEEQLSAWFADQVITTNELHKVVLATHGVPPQKIEIVLNVGNDRIFFPRTNRQKNDGLTLVYHGTVAERLGLDIILEAMEICKKKCPDLVFILIGREIISFLFDVW